MIDAAPHVTDRSPRAHYPGQRWRKISVSNGAAGPSQPRVADIAGHGWRPWEVSQQRLAGGSVGERHLLWTREKSSIVTEPTFCMPMPVEMKVSPAGTTGVVQVASVQVEATGSADDCAHQL